MSVVVTLQIIFITNKILHFFIFSYSDSSCPVYTGNPYIQTLVYWSSKGFSHCVFEEHSIIEKDLSLETFRRITEKIP